MANDDIFGDLPETPQEAPTETPQEESFTGADAKAMIEQIGAQNTAATQQAIAGLGQSVTDAVTAALSDALAPKPAPASNEDLSTELLSNPKEALSREVSAILEPQVAAFQEQRQGIDNALFETQHQLLIRDEKEKVDSEFGEGTWDKEFAPDLDPIFNNLRAQNPAALANQAIINQGVVGVKGGPKFDTLQKARVEAAEAAAQSNDRKVQDLASKVTTLTGGAPMMGAPKTGLSDEQREIQDRMNAVSSMQVSDEDIELARSTNDYPTWKAAMDAAKGDK